MTLLLNTTPSADQTRLNKTRWREVVTNPEIIKMEWRIETDRLGRIIMSPPPRRIHGRRQSRIAFLLETHLGAKGITFTECPVNTADGVKGAVVAWMSFERDAISEDADLPEIAPEICVEVLSSRNSAEEMAEKKALYFGAGAEEFWICDDGAMRFYLAGSPDLAADSSKLCSEFPQDLGI